MQPQKYAKELSLKARLHVATCVCRFFLFYLKTFHLCKYLFLLLGYKDCVLIFYCHIFVQNFNVLKETRFKTTQD